MLGVVLATKDKLIEDIMSAPTRVSELTAGENKYRVGKLASDGAQRSHGSTKENYWA